MTMGNLLPLSDEARSLMRAIEEWHQGRRIEDDRLATLELILAGVKMHRGAPELADDLADELQESIDAEAVSLEIPIEEWIADAADARRRRIQPGIRRMLQGAGRRPAGMTTADLGDSH